MSYLDERIKIDGIELYQVAIPLLVPFENLRWKKLQQAEHHYQNDLRRPGGLRRIGAF